MNAEEIDALRRNNLVRHITNVRQSCELLGDRLIKTGEKRVGHTLFAHAQIHDNSKWHGVEWEYLTGCPPEGDNQLILLQQAIKQHNTTNPHHPPYWDSEPGSGDGVGNMPRVYLAEMVCDWHARSHELNSGLALMEWVKQKATKQFNMTVQSRAYKDIKGLIETLLDPAFK